MKVSQNKIDDLNLELTVEIEAADYAEIERKKLAERKRNADFKGFRKGMVPLAMIKRVYGEQCLAESVNQVISEALDKHISENKLHVLGEPLSSEKQPEIEWTDGNDFTFIFDVALSPEVSVEVEKKDTVPSYTVSVSDDEKSKMTESLKKYYEEKKEEKSDEDIAKEVDDRLSSQYKNESEWRLNKDIRDYFVKKANLSLPEAFLKRWLVVANNGKLTAEDVEKDFPGFAEDFKWQLVRGFLMRKYDFKVEDKDLHEAAEGMISKNSPHGISLAGCFICPDAAYSFILSFRPENIVSGLSSITADSSPAMQKPHLSHIPSDSPAHCGLRVPSAYMKLVIQQQRLKRLSLIFNNPLREFMIGYPRFL